jgi:hypothetical protein
MPVIAEVSWDYHRGAREPVFQVLKSWFVSAGDSSTFGFFVHESPTTLGTPSVVGSCYVSSVCYQVASCCSDQGVDLGHHIGVLMRT